MTEHRWSLILDRNSVTIKGGNQLWNATEVMVKMKYFCPGRMASNPSIKSDRMFMVYRLKL